MVLDDLVKHFAYDGLGRLIRVQSPLPAPGSGALRSERFFYDGIRRVQEIVIDPVSETDESLMAGGGVGAAAAAAFAAEPDLDGSTATLAVENSQTEAAGGGGGGPPSGTSLEREYIWGPGDGGGGVDELLVQYDKERVPWWVIQDAGLDCIALCDLAGPGDAARVVWQGSYDAYGSVLTAESLYAHAHLRAGHKGLLFDRLDLGVLDPYTGYEVPRLAATAKLAGHMRNRVLLPELGRFAQRDPNATGLPTQASAIFGGNAFETNIPGLSLGILYGDGANVYGYVRNDPWNRSDPLGLYSWEDWWEDTKEGADVLVNGLQTVSAFGDPGGLLGAMLNSLVENYTANVDSDVMWGGDWSLQDDWHTRGNSKWVRQAIWMGVYGHFNLGYWAEWSSSGPAMAGGVLQIVRIGGNIVTRGQLHHLMPRYLARFFTCTKEIVGRIPGNLHGQFHRRLDNLMRADGFPPMNQKHQWTRYMQRHPQKLGLIRMRIRQFTAQFELEHNIQGLLEGLDEILP